MNCQELAGMLHAIGLSDAKLAEACDVSRVYFCNVRNGRKPGGGLLQEKLQTLVEIASQRGLFHEKHTPIIVDALPPTPAAVPSVSPPSAARVEVSPTPVYDPANEKPHTQHFKGSFLKQLQQECYRIEARNKAFQEARRASQVQIPVDPFPDESYRFYR